MNKKTIAFIILALVVVFGSIAFWYYRETIFSTQILALEISGPQQAKMGDEVEYTVTYKNSGNFVLENPKLVFQLPENSLTEDGKGRISQNLDDLHPGNQKKVSFKLRLLGKEGDVKSVRASLSYTPHNLSVRYEAEATLDTTIETVPVTLTFDAPSKIEQGKETSYSVNYFSNVDYPLENMSIKIEPLPGFGVVKADPKSLDNVEWKLPVLQKGQGGKITIQGSIISGNTGARQFAARLGMWIEGSFVVIKETQHDVEIIPSTVLPVLTLSQSIDQPAGGTYTVHWRVKNEANVTKNVKVKAMLPFSTTLGDNIIPEDQAEHFSWDNVSRQIIWLVGDLGVGATNSLSFEITPPPLNPAFLSNISVSGEDQFTGAPVLGTITP